MTPLRILYVTSEAYPLIKTGGLADVAGSLPRALHQLGHDVRILLPAYQSVLAGLRQRPQVRLQTRLGAHALRILQTSLPGSRVPVWLLDCPALFDRPGNPYHNARGEPWPDNAERFALLGQVGALLGRNQLGVDWQPQLVHGNDWQSGLLPVYLQQAKARPATVFTIHNLAYQGVFDRAAFTRLKLPEYYWHYERLEYHGSFAFIKGGLAYADRINTVSPSYAREIQTPAFGHGMEALLQHRADRLSGILNGIDTRIWNPGTDRQLTSRYNWQRLAGKAPNKSALQQHYGLPQRDEVMLLGLVSRLVEQKGIDLVLDSLPRLSKQSLQLVILGSGEPRYERALQAAARTHRGCLAVQLGYDEALAHQVEAGADVFLMPSRFEPCGLNQMYSQRYGTLPLVAPVGGLRDTVRDASSANLAAGRATGYVMPAVTAAALQATVQRALRLFAEPQRWQQLQRTAMKQDFSWERSAGEYTALYEQALRDHARAL